MNLKECYRRFRAWQKNPFDYTNHSVCTERCSNCGTEFSDNFCPRCGQKAGVGPVDWSSVKQGVSMVWGMDSRSLGYSLLQLLLRPGYMISDYISGKRQVSFPPVKMLLIVAIGEQIAEYLFGALNSDLTEKTTTRVTSPAYEAFSNWSEANPGWTMLVICILLLYPTWLLFRNSPNHRRHTLPQGFFIQVFMSSLLSMVTIFAIILDSYWVLGLMPFCYLFAYRQLFRYNWWSTIWRTCLCVILGTCSLFILVCLFLGGRDMWIACIMLSVYYVIMALIGYLIDRKNKKKYASKSENI